MPSPWPGHRLMRLEEAGVAVLATAVSAAAVLVSIVAADRVSVALGSAMADSRRAARMASSAAAMNMKTSMGLP